MIALSPQNDQLNAAKKLGVLAVMLTVMTGCANSPNISIPVYETPVVYAGLGIGASKLDVDTTRRTFAQRGSTSTAAQLTAGVSMAESWGLEARFADLGDAEFDNGLKLGYQVADLSVLGKFALGDRVHAFGRLGFGVLENDGDFEVRQVNKTHVVIGAGIDVSLSRRFGLRLEAMGHDIDASHAQLSLLYRFNPPTTRTASSVPVVVSDREPSQPLIQAPEPNGSTAIVKPAEPSDTPIPTITPTPAKIDVSQAATVDKPIRPRPDTTVAIAKTPPSNKVALDTDKDGVIDVLDVCASSVANAIVNVMGCDLFGPVTPGVLFANGSAILSANGSASLDDVVERLKEFPAIKVIIGAYSSGSEDSASDLLLSRRRTIAVIRYMRDAGIDATRLQPNAMALVAEAGDDSYANRIAIKRQ